MLLRFRVWVLQREPRQVLIVSRRNLVAAAEALNVFVPNNSNQV